MATKKTAVKSKPATKIAKKPIKAEVVVAAPVIIEDSAAKQQFRAFVNKLKADNPAAYAKNETELLKKLNQL